MPTPSEQKALAFVAIVVLLAGAVRVVRAGAFADHSASPGEMQALSRQAFAASSTAVQQDARHPQAARQGSRSRRGKGGRAAPASVGGVESVPRGDVRPDRLVSPHLEDPSNRFGFPPPSPRIDIGPQARSNTAADPLWPSKHPRSALKANPERVDVDHATAEELERLPRVGPALARRIIASRDSLGPFRRLEAMSRVRGIGPSTLKLIQPLVTFSEQTRP